MGSWDDVFLPYLPVEKILASYAASPGDEIGRGKLRSKESSAALAANVFGLFLDRAGDLPMLPGLERCGWPATKVSLEAELRFPWSGGLHPWLDVLVDTPTHLIAIESKRYEPYRSRKMGEFSDAYARDVWGAEMHPFEKLRDCLKSGSVAFEHLDAFQLVKHAFGLRTQASKRKRIPVLFYLYAEPASWPGPGGAVIAPEVHQQHAAEIERFATAVAGAEVSFVACTYRRLLSAFEASPTPDIRMHAAALTQHFAV